MSIKSFEAASSTDDFVKTISGELSKRELGKIVSLKKDGADLLVVFSKLGTSEIRFQVDAVGTGFKATLKNEKIAFTHRPFRGDIEAKFASILTKNGAKIS